MKCFVLAGGTGDRLWPISRKDYPKQFTAMREGHSLFQETIVKNMPFCDEFYIFTNEKYLNIVRGQLQSFKNLKYKLFIETAQLKTALPILIAAFSCSKDELILIVSADAAIGDGNYKESITDARRLAEAGYLTLLTIPAKELKREYKYVECDGEKIKTFIERADDLPEFGKKDYRYDVGISVNKNDVLLKQFEHNSPEVYHKTEDVIKRFDFSAQVIFLDCHDFADVPKLSLGKALRLDSGIARAVMADFKWDCCLNLETLSLAANVDDNVLLNKCGGVSVINTQNDKLVVVNGISDAVIVNTRNAVYISSKNHSAEIKDIIRNSGDKYKYYFEEGEKYYQPWGIKEYISVGKGYRITKMTVFPGKFLQEHSHLNRSEHWSIVCGTACITIGGFAKNYTVGEDVFAAPRVLHSIGNTSDEPAMLIETAVSPDIEGVHADYIKSFDEQFFHLLPAYKDYLWGGTKIKDILGKPAPYQTVAESWEISAHPVGQSVVLGGKYDGIPFGALLSRLGKSSLGWKAQAFDRFPILAKFIDARLSLSIQVHPGDDYALTAEHEYGKNEMWYVMDCDEDSYIYLGFNRDVTSDEIRSRIADNTLTEILNKIPVKRGDAFFIPAGTVHAIGAGAFICEIQQNSNVTYRLYDFGRRDKNGNLRALHIDKALDVLNLSKFDYEEAACSEAISLKSDSMETLCSCKYFSVEKYTVNGEYSLFIDSSSFAGIIITAGSGTISVLDKIENFKTGDSFFVPAKEAMIKITGKCEFLKAGV